MIKENKISVVSFIDSVDQLEKNIYNFQRNLFPNVKFYIYYNNVKLKNTKIEQNTGITLKKTRSQSKIKIYNWVINHLKTDYIYFYENTELEDNFFKSVISEINLTTPDIFFCNYRINKKIINNPFLKEIIPQKHIFSPLDCKKNFFDFLPFYLSLFFFKVTFLKKENIFYPELHRMSDVFFIQKAFLKSKKIVFYSEILLNLCPPKMDIQNINKYWKDSFLCYEILGKDLLTLCTTYKNSYINMMFKHLIRDTLNCMIGFQRNEGIIYLQKFVKLHPFCLKYYSHHTNFSILKSLHKNLFEYKSSNFFLHKKIMDIIPICFSINNTFVPYLCVTLQSIKENRNLEKIYDIYVLHTSISEYNQKILENLTCENFKITCYNVENLLPTKVKELYTLSHITTETYYRFLIPELFYMYPKVLYIDSDVICQKDVSELFNIDLKNYLFAGVLNPLFWDSQLKIEKSYNLNCNTYINAGLILFNIKECQRQNLTKNCWRLSFETMTKFIYSDQDILNILAQDQILLLPWNWNVMVGTLNWKCFYTQQLLLKFFPREIYLLHYTTKEKPWHNFTNENPLITVLNKIWWCYARKSVLYDKILCDYLKKVTKKDDNA